VRKDGLAVYVEVDAALEQILGWSRDELVGRRSLDLIHPDDHERAIASWLEMLTRAGEAQRVRLRHHHRDGTWVWFELSNQNHLDPSGAGYVETEMLDISDEMAMQEALREREQLLSQLTEALPTGVLQILPDRRVVYANTRLSTIVGLPIETTLAEQFASAVPDDRSQIESAVDRVLLDGANEQVEVRVADPATGELRFTTMTLQALYDADGAVSGALITVADVTESVLLRAELEDRATYDALTHCLNRASIMQMLEQMLAEGRRPGVLFVDVDSFKEINDGLGHNAGDEVLVTLADLMRSESRSSDVVGRMGGDEFIIVCPQLEPSEAARLRERTTAGVNRLVTLPPGVGSVTVSVGFSCTDGPEETADSLVARADSAMYVVKRQHHGGAVGGAQPERRVRKPVVATPA
jgi:diguanylate cyclase (GGDEF)-like protein/PAS domain S-box-containing protein